MPVFAFIPQLFIIGVALFMAVIILGVVAIRRLPEWNRRAHIRRMDARRLAGVARESAWKAGEDLAAYPARLAEQEHQLISARHAALERAAYLRTKAKDVGQANPHGRVADGAYHRQAGSLDAMAQEIERLIVRQWRARSLVSLRVHAAVTARSAPEHDPLPSPVPPESAEKSLGDAAAAARGFLINVANRLDELDAAVPDHPGGIAVPEEIVAEVEAERARVQALYRTALDRLNAVADDLELHLESSRTAALLDRMNLVSSADHHHATDLAAAVSALDGDAELLAPFGSGLQEAIAALDEPISALERSEEDAAAQTRAAEEVARLLQRFESP
jgi:hypothetical protein